MVKRVASEPVPAVVGIATIGRPGSSCWRGAPCSRACWPPWRASTATALAVSIRLPPPKPTTQSKSPAWRAASAASTEATVGSGTVSEKIVARAPAAGEPLEQRVGAAAAGEVGVGDHEGARQAELAEHLRQEPRGAGADAHQPGQGDRGDHSVASPSRRLCWSAGTAILGPARAGRNYRRLHCRPGEQRGGGLHLARDEARHRADMGRLPVILVDVHVERACQGYRPGSTGTRPGWAAAMKAGRTQRPAPPSVAWTWARRLVERSRAETGGPRAPR